MGRVSKRTMWFARDRGSDKCKIFKSEPHLKKSDISELYVWVTDDPDDYVGFVRMDFLPHKYNFCSQKPMELNIRL